jgi:glucokinase
MNPSIAIGIDLGGTNLKIAVVTRDGQILAKHAVPINAESGPDAIIRYIATEVDRILAEVGLDRSSVIGVGIGTPGPLNIAEGKIIHAANLPGFKNVPIRDRLGDLLQLPVTLENDGNAAAFGEWWMGAPQARPCNASIESSGGPHSGPYAPESAASGRRAGSTGDLVMLTLGTGVGGGVVLGGKLLHGHFDNAGELGHMIVVPDGLPCTCGQKGCLEQYCSASAIARRVEAALQCGESSCVVGSAVRTAHSQGAINGEDVAHAAQAGDSLCLRIWDEACRYLAIACINIQHTFNPERIVFGGGMSNAGEFLLDPVVQHIGERKWNLHNDIPAVTLATLGYDAGVIGAAALAWNSSTAPRTE